MPYRVPPVGRLTTWLARIDVFAPRGEVVCSWSPFSGGRSTMRPTRGLHQRHYAGSCRLVSFNLRRTASVPGNHRHTSVKTTAESSFGRCQVYFTDRGIEELADRRGAEDVTLAWVAERLREFVDLNPEFETPVERLATWLARLDDED